MMTSPIRSWQSRRNARVEYEAAEVELSDVFDQLSVAGEPADRARLLDDAALIADSQAEAYRLWRGPDPIPEENGRDLSDSMHSTALLYALVADVEDAVAAGVELDLTGYVIAPAVTAALPILTRMTRTPNAIGRAVLLAALHDAVEPHVGGQAAEAVACLPSPGYIGWEPIQRRGDWYTAMPAGLLGLCAILRTAAHARLLSRLRGLPGLYRWIDRAPTEQLAHARAGAAFTAARSAAAVAACPRCRHGIIPAAGDATRDLGPGGAMRCDRCRGTSLIERAADSR